MPTLTATVLAVLALTAEFIMHPQFDTHDPMTSEPDAATPSKSKARTALVLAGVLCLITFALAFLLSGGEGATTFALRANQPIPARAALVDTMFDVVAIPDEHLPPSAFIGGDEEEVMEAASLTGAVALYPIEQGEELTPSMLTKEATLPEPLLPEERLISVRSAFSDALAGSIVPGDRVDVYGVGDNSFPVAQMLIADVEIVSVSISDEQATAVVQNQVNAVESGENVTRAEALPGDPIPMVYTLRVDESDVGRLVVVNKLAEVALVLRGEEAATVATWPTDLLSALCGLPSVPEDVQLPVGSSLSVPDACNGISSISFDEGDQFRDPNPNEAAVDADTGQPVAN